MMEHLWPGSPLVFLLAWFGWRIANKAGYSGFWGLTAIIPPLGLLVLWIFAASGDWPRERGAVSTRPRNGGAKDDGIATGIVVRRPGSDVTRP
ncbi:MAG: hypothetical protein VYB54_06950 [Pseudomonadota bacterium]|nr:hypothetical protein [Pseudomonadota bacterium]